MAALLGEAVVLVAVALRIPSAWLAVAAGSRPLQPPSASPLPVLPAVLAAAVVGVVVRAQHSGPFRKFAEVAEDGGVGGA